MNNNNTTLVFKFSYNSRSGTRSPQKLANSDIYGVQKKAYQSYVDNYKLMGHSNPYFTPKFRPHSSQVL